MAQVVLIALEEFEFGDRSLKPGDEVYLEAGMAANAIQSYSKKLCYSSQFSETLLKKAVRLDSNKPNAKQQKAV